MQLTLRQSLLFGFCVMHHGDQKRKYTGEPYFVHLYEVAEIVDTYVKGDYVIETAFMHDLFEDTELRKSGGIAIAHEFLKSIGYDGQEIITIIEQALELTDVFTKEDYPHLNRKARKQAEIERCSTISPPSQSVKYADIFHNGKSIIKHDKDFARVFVHEKNDLLEVMKEGNKELYDMASAVVANTLLSNEELAEEYVRSHPDFEAEGLSEYMNGILNGFIAGRESMDEKKV